MKLNSLSSSSRSLFRRAPQLAACGALAFGLQIACSDAPATPGPSFQGTSGAATTTTGGTPAATAGTPGSAGTPVASAGTFSSAGTFAAAGTGGSDAGGTGGQVAGGTGGAAAGTANGGTGGVIVAAPYCMGKTAATLPFVAETGNPAWLWSEGPPVVAIPGNDGTADVAVDACKSRVAGAAGSCSKWRVTPPATVLTYAFVAWSPNPDTAPHTCLPADVTTLAYCARGEKGGEKISVGGANVPEAEITLTDAWKAYSIAISADGANTFDKGVAKTFAWKTDPLPAVATEFFIDNIQYIKGALPTNYCGAAGGTGGSGGTGGTGGGGTGGTNN